MKFIAIFYMTNPLTGEPVERSCIYEDENKVSALYHAKTEACDTGFDVRVYDYIILQEMGLLDLVLRIKGIDCLSDVWQELSDIGKKILFEYAQSLVNEAIKVCPEEKLVNLKWQIEEAIRYNA